MADIDIPECEKKIARHGLYMYITEKEIWSGSHSSKTANIKILSANSKHKS